MPEWTIAEPQKLTFDGTIKDLNVRTVGGTVNVVGTDEGSARLEVGEIEGPPLIVTRKGSTLTISYEDLPWKGLLGWLDRKGWRRRAVVSVAVPTATRVELGVVSANAVVSGISGAISLQGVSGDTTLVGVTGPVNANTVSGSVDAQDVSGDLRVNTVSGELTVVEGTGGRVKADSVSGGMVLDLDPRSGTDVRLSTVSGEVAIRLPGPCDAKVDANTTSGDVSTAFDELHLTNQWGAKRLTGTLGSGSGKLRVTTVTGSVALLRRPPGEDETGDVSGKVL
jgi:Putative adhesin